jgi:hypothetical protein
MTVMELISRAIDKLPMWARVIFWAFAVLVSAYCIARYGFTSFILHAIFSP